jgi:hypothetical protein
MKLLGSLVAVVALIPFAAAVYARAAGAEPPALATVEVFNARETLIQGVFACTNDPAGITTGVQLLSSASVEHDAGGGKVASPYTSLSVTRTGTNGDTVNTLFEASGFSFDIGPTVDRRRLTTGSVAGAVSVDIFSQGGGAANAAFQFTFTADTSKPTIEGPFVSNFVYPDGTRLVSRVVGQTQPATATGSISITDPGSGAVILACPLQSTSNHEVPTVIQFVRTGTITITK